MEIENDHYIPNNVNIYYNNCLNNYINNNNNNIWINNNHYFSNDNKLNEVAETVYKTIKNYFGFDINFTTIFEKNMVAQTTNYNTFNKIKNLFKNRGFTNEKIIDFLIFKLIITRDINTINSNYNELFNIKSYSQEIIDYWNSRETYQTNLEMVKKAYYSQRQKLTTIQETIKTLGDSIPIESKCSICISNTKSHVIVPCGHKSICGECSPRILQDGTCPICRENIQCIIKVYES